VVARVSGGQVHAVVAVPEGVTVRVEGHGVRAAASRGQLRIDADLSAIAARLARAADSADCPKARAVQAAREKKLSEATRRLALARKRGSRSAGDARGDAAAADVRTDDTGGA
jgi:hypothetical protein